MAENKTQRTKTSVAAFLATIPDPHRQRDAKVLAALIRKTTGERPAMWGPSIVGYGQMIYYGSNGRAEIDTTVLTRIIRRSNTGNRHVTKR